MENVDFDTANNKELSEEELEEDEQDDEVRRDEAESKQSAAIAGDRRSQHATMQRKSASRRQSEAAADKQQRQGLRSHFRRSKKLNVTPYLAYEKKQRYQGRRLASSVGESRGGDLQKTFCFEPAVFWRASTQRRPGERGHQRRRRGQQAACVL